MPYSAPESRPWMLERLTQLAPKTLLDIGAGSGTYGRLFNEHFPDAITVGVEVWTPYLDQFGLDELYDRMINEDVRTMAWWPTVDVVIFGDVLEHMSVAEARYCWAQARQSARKAVYLAIPIVHYPQGAEHGNPYEEHVVDDWSHEQVLDTFEGIGEHWCGATVGVYEALT